METIISSSMLEPLFFISKAFRIVYNRKSCRKAKKKLEKAYTLSEGKCYNIGTDGNHDIKDKGERHGKEDRN